MKFIQAFLKSVSPYIKPVIVLSFGYIACQHPSFKRVSTYTENLQDIGRLADCNPEKIRRVRLLTTGLSQSDFCQTLSHDPLLIQQRLESENDGIISDLFSLQVWENILTSISSTRFITVGFEISRSYPYFTKTLDPIPSQAPWLEQRDFQLWRLNYIPNILAIPAMIYSLALLWVKLKQELEDWKKLHSFQSRLTSEEIEALRIAWAAERVKVRHLKNNMVDHVARLLVAALETNNSSHYHEAIDFFTRLGAKPQDFPSLADVEEKFRRHNLNTDQMRRYVRKLPIMRQSVRKILYLRQRQYRVK